MLQKITITALALGALLTGSIALAQTGSTTAPVKPLPVVFPIAVLGGCDSKDACRAYCDVAANRDACYAYAQTHGLMRADQIEKARAFLKEHEGTSTPPGIRPKENASSTIDELLATHGGPGGCTTKDACKTFCDDPANSTVCLQFAQDHHLMSTTSIMLAKKLQTQVGPGGCRGEECKQYCNDESHAQLCVAFAQQNGFISKDDADKRMQHMNISSTTRPLLIPVNGTGTVASSTQRERPDIRPAGTLKPPPPHREASSTGQSGSIFFAILHFFGL